MPDWVLAKAPEPGAGVVWSNSVGRGASLSAGVTRAIRWAMNLAPGEVWRNQPYVRIVLPFVARNVAQVGLHMYERVSDTDRRRVTDHPLAQMLGLKSNDRNTAFELFFATQIDRMLYDRAYWALGDRAGEPQIIRIPSVRIVETEGDDPLGPVENYIALRPNGERVRIPGRMILEFPGYDPVDVDGIPTSPLDALKSVIAEQAAAFEFRKNTWENGGQLSGVITRPAEAEWSEKARERFMADWRSQFGRRGPQNGGTALLEDGMTYDGQQFNAHEAEWIDAAKLSLALVASMYHVNPTMVGLMDNANYSNVKEFHRMLYQDTLGPTFAEYEQRINAFLLPRFPDTEGRYMEFNIAEKLEGSFEEQATAFQASVGAPWLTRNEARARQNLPAVQGGDELVTPLNVLVGSQASPVDAGPEPDPNARPEQSARQLEQTKATVLQLKAAPDDPVLRRSIDIVSAFFRRQAAVISSRVGAGQTAYQTERWKRELATVMLQVNLLASTAAGKKALEQLGVDADEWDEDRTIGWLTANADGVSDGINQTVKARVENAIELDDEHDPDEELEHPGLSSVLLTLAGSYAVLTATSQTTAMSGWGTIEAANQQGVQATKTWDAGSNPRSSHASMNGETVPVGEEFSNGARWPGDSSLSDDERAGCNCQLTINIQSNEGR
jgi:HK97 family phage portal protein